MQKTLQNLVKSEASMGHPSSVGQAQGDQIAWKSMLKRLNLNLFYEKHAKMLEFQFILCYQRTRKRKKTLEIIAVLAMWGSFWGSKSTFSNKFHKII